MRRKYIVGDFDTSGWQQEFDSKREAMEHAKESSEFNFITVWEVNADHYRVKDDYGRDYGILRKWYFNPRKKYSKNRLYLVGIRGKFKQFGYKVFPWAEEVSPAPKRDAAREYARRIAQYSDIDVWEIDTDIFDIDNDSYYGIIHRDNYNAFKGKGTKSIDEIAHIYNFDLKNCSLSNALMLQEFAYVDGKLSSTKKEYKSSNEYVRFYAILTGIGIIVTIFNIFGILILIFGLILFLISFNNKITANREIKNLEARSIDLKKRLFNECRTSAFSKYP